MSYSRLLGTWLVLAILMPLNGIFRELFLKKHIASAPADVISAGLGVVIILTVTRLLFRIDADTPRRTLVAMSALLVFLTVAFESAFGLAEGRTAAELLDHYALWRGRLWPIVLAVLAATPFIHRRRSSP